MQKLIEFHNNKEVDMLKLGCTLPNLSKVCFNISTDSYFFSSTKTDKDLIETIQEGMVGAPSVVFPV